MLLCRRINHLSCKKNGLIIDSINTIDAIKAIDTIELLT